jgi:hypothetical protein
MAEASTVPTTLSSVGTDSCDTLATDTGTTGMPPIPGRAACCLQPVKAKPTANTTKILFTG